MWSYRLYGYLQRDYRGNSKWNGGKRSMKKYISLDKRSKKAQKKYYAGFRRTWDGVNPVIRTMPNGKAYNRKKDKEKMRKIDCLSENRYTVDFFMKTFMENRSLTSVLSLIK
mgnify:CR=1 FL=1